MSAEAAPRFAKAIVCLGGLLLALPWVPLPIAHAISEPPTGTSIPPGSGAPPPVARPVDRPMIAPSPLTPSNLTGNWSFLGSPPGIAPRDFPALASDPDLGGVVLFGGGVANLSAAFPGTWLYRNGTWSNLSASFSDNPPHGRLAVALVWDPTADELVLFGGRNGSESFNDTWVLTATNVSNGHGWSNLTTPRAPSPRAFAGSFFDPNRSAIILYGGACEQCGANRTNLTFNDTWSFRNGTWTNVTPTNGVGPAGRFAGFSAWDPDLQRGIYVGGDTGARGCRSANSTWAYDGNWTQLSTNTTPGNVSDGALEWYPPGHELLLVAGEISTGAGCSASGNGTRTLAGNNTWVLTGRTWNDLSAVSSSASTIGARFGAGGAYDPYAHVALIFGGAVNNTTALDDLWSFPAAPLEAAIATAGIAAANDSPLLFQAEVSGGQSPYYYHWNFGDGSPVVGGSTAGHVYTAPGTFTVGLEVLDDAGRSWNASASVEIVPPLQLNVSHGPVHGDVPFAVTFNSSTSGGVPPYNWSWAFGDGFLWNSPNVTHTFTIEGTFRVNLTAYDSIGDNRSFVVTVVVGGRMIASILPSAYDALSPATLNFSAFLKGGTNPFTYAWTFAPGDTAAGPQVSFTFRTNGTYTVSLQVTDSLGYVAVASATIHVYAPLTATCTPSTPAGVAPFTESFRAGTVGGAPPLFYTWDFGDGSPQVPGLSTSHEYYDAGHYTVTVRVTDQLNESVNATTSVLVVAPLTVTATSDAPSGPGPVSVDFTTTIHGGLAPFTFTWIYGDGGVGAGPNGSHTYDATGHFTARESVQDALGENVTAPVSEFVYPALVVAVSATPSLVTLGNVSELGGNVTGGVEPIELWWTGLPPGCLSRNSTGIDCYATQGGSYRIGFHARDAVGENQTANLTLEVTTAAGCACPGATASGGALLWAAAGGIAAAAVAAIGGLVLLRRRRGRSPPDEPGDEAT